MPPLYTSNLKNLPFLYAETKRTAKLLKAKEPPEAIIKRSIDENIFQLKKERRRNELPRAILKRLGNVPESVINLIADGEDESARLAAFYALIRTDLLFFEFTDRVYKPAIEKHQTEIAESDVSAFFLEKRERNAQIAAWKQDNIAALKATYKRILCEAGLAIPATDGGTNKAILIKKPITTSELKSAFSHLCGGDKYTEAMGLVL
jgi:hypothetical protein